MILDKLDATINSMLLTNLTMEIDGKVWKNLFLSHYALRDFHLELYSSGNCVKLLIPFTVEFYPDERLVFLDYRLKTFCEVTNQVEERKHQNVAPGNKFLDKILTIKSSIR